MASLICAGAHAQDLLAIWSRVRPKNLIAIYDDDPQLGFYPLPDQLTGRILIGVNDPIARRRIANRYSDLRGTHQLIDSSAVIGINIDIGKGSVVAPLACLLRDVQLGKHVHVNYQASITRCTVDDFTTISPGATICGDVTIGKECLIGAGATICDRVTIGSGVIIGAGAIIPPLSNVPDGKKVVGVWKDN